VFKTRICVLVWAQIKRLSGLVSPRARPPLHSTQALVALALALALALAVRAAARARRRRWRALPLPLPCTRLPTDSVAKALVRRDQSKCGHSAVSMGVCGNVAMW
jgi:hypothetical protein